MPLAPEQYGHRKIEPFLWGLLPDNEIVLGQWARKFHVSPRNAFGLIANVGEDCAGAVQFVRPERLGAVRLGAPQEVQWLDEAAVADRLRALHQDQSAWRIPRDTGQFSLAGAQPKTALLLDNGRWGVPSGRLPTTHILKPPTGEFDGHAENEHFCLQLARSFDLPTANSEIRRFEDQIAIIVERYDRIRTGRTIRRVHQEDVCQALGLLPTKKYQGDGGPGVREIAGLLTTFSTAPAQDTNTFVGAIAFNWLVAGTDAHSKNYALLLGSESRVRLAPLYDLASALPYPGMRPIGLKLAMKIGGEYRLRNIAARHWRRLATEVRQNPEELLGKLRVTAEAMPDHVLQIQQLAKGDGLVHPVVDRLSEKLIARAKECGRLLK
jgi:serine/threonine-protein kinase HipA